MRVRIALNSHVYDTVSYFFGGSTLMLAYLVYNNYTSQNNNY